MALFLVLLLVLILFGAGFAFKALFVLAAILALFWIAGFVMAAPSARWYRW
jgi:hypothetical protein